MEHHQDIAGATPEHLACATPVTMADSPARQAHSRVLLPLSNLDQTGRETAWELTFVINQ